jgi:N-acetylglucosaminyldiphosphoundecaprenol N-acetyl-beta-D-mannosaminyltransferase
MSLRATPSQASCERSEAAEPGTLSQSNLARSVYCILGIPIDAIGLTTVAHRIEAAATQRSPLLISTPNLNFLVSSLSDPEFRESVLESDLCPPDGAPIIWIARLLGVPITERAAGADLLERLQVRSMGARRLTVFLLGGAEGVAAGASRKLNARPGGLTCVGTMNPGFGDVDEMSHDHIIDAVNSSGADFLILSLGAKKAQLWLSRNRNRLAIPIRRACFASSAVDSGPPAGGIDAVAAVQKGPQSTRPVDQENAA